VARFRQAAAVGLMCIAASGCGLTDRFDAPERRINTAVPSNSAVQAAHQMLLAQTTGQVEAQKAIDQAWAHRLKLRALACSRGYTPGWRDSAADIRSRISDATCLQDADRVLQLWVGLQRVRLMLAQPALRAVSTDATPPTISHTEQIYNLTPAREAAVALLTGPTGFDIVDLRSAKSLFREASGQSPNSLMSVSPNGRLFYQASAGKVVIRASEGGETLVELSPADGLVWLDANAVAIRRNNTQALQVLDLASGEESAMPGGNTTWAYAAVRAPGANNRFVLLGTQGATQIEVIDAGGRYEARLLAERGPSNGKAFAQNTGDMSADGSMWVDGHQGVRVLSLDSLELAEPSFSPLSTQTAWATPTAGEFVLSAALPTGDGITSQFNYYVYSHSAGTLARIKRDPESSTKYKYVASVKRLALMDGRTVRYLDKLPVDEPQPVAVAAAAFLDEMNQRRIAAAAKAADAAVQSTPIHGRPTAAPLLPQLADTQVEGVGVYEGEGARHGGAQARTPGVVEVRVRRSPRPITLVLASYEPVRWMIVSEGGARLAAVLVSGYHQSSVVGAGDARVVQIGQAYAYEQKPTGGGNYSDLQRDVTRWVGKPIGVFQGRYQGSRFSVGGQPLW
jgi:hypothetical protein